MSIGGKKIIHIKKKENSEKRFTNPSDQAIANEHKNVKEKLNFFLNVELEIEFCQICIKLPNIF